MVTRPQSLHYPENLDKCESCLKNCSAFLIHLHLQSAGGARRRKLHRIAALDTETLALQQLLAEKLLELRIPEENSARIGRPKAPSLF